MKAHEPYMMVHEEHKQTIIIYMHRINICFLFSPPRSRLDFSVVLCCFLACSLLSLELYCQGVVRIARFAFLWNWKRSKPESHHCYMHGYIPTRGVYKLRKGVIRKLHNIDFCLKINENFWTIYGFKSWHFKITAKNNNSWNDKITELLVAKAFWIHFKRAVKFEIFNFTFYGVNIKSNFAIHILSLLPILCHCCCYVCVVGC